MLKPIRKLKSRLHISSNEVRMLLFAFVLFMVGALAYVWPNIKMINIAYEFQAIQKTHQALLKENNLLKLEKASLQSLNRIQSLSDARLGLHKPEKDQVVTIFLK